MYILTNTADTGYAGATKITHRTTDKQLYDVEAKKVLAKVTYDKDKGVLTMIVQPELLDTITTQWHEAWRIAHKDHPRYPSYNRYPYAITFAAARSEEELRDNRME